MKIASIDSSSAIILFRAGFFEEAASFLTFIYAEKVFREITVPGRKGSEHFIDISPDSIKNVKLAENLSSYAGLGEGERDAINLVFSGLADYVVIDDRKGALYCSKNSIPYVNALLLPAILYLSGRISIQRRDEAVSGILETGRYSKMVTERAALMGEAELAFFLSL